MPKSHQREAVIVELVALLKTERLRQKLSVNEVATRSGLSHAMVSRVERRQRTPTIDTLLRLGEALGVRISALLDKAERTVTAAALTRKV